MAIWLNKDEIPLFEIHLLNLSIHQPVHVGITNKSVSLASITIVNSPEYMGR